MVLNAAATASLLVRAAAAPTREAGSPHVVSRAGTLVAPRHESAAIGPHDTKRHPTPTRRLLVLAPVARVPRCSPPAGATTTMRRTPPRRPRLPRPRPRPPTPHDRSARRPSDDRRLRRRAARRSTSSPPTTRSAASPRRSLPGTRFALTNASDKELHELVVVQASPRARTARSRSCSPCRRRSIDAIFGAGPADDGAAGDAELRRGDPGSRRRHRDRARATTSPSASSPRASIRPSSWPRPRRPATARRRSRAGRRTRCSACTAEFTVEG